MNKELFLQKMSDLADKLESNGIALYELDNMITRHLNIPDEAGWKVVETELSNIGLCDFDETSKYYGFQIYAHLQDYGDEGPKFDINIHDMSPFFISIRAIDSYHNPQMDYECGKTYIDDDQLFENYPSFNELDDEKKKELIKEYTYDNDNWEPSEYGKAETNVREPEEIWSWLKEQVEKFKKEWEA